jgi:hypothetical protein
MDSGLRVDEARMHTLTWEKHGRVFVAGRVQTGRPEGWNSSSLFFGSAFWLLSRSTIRGPAIGIE